jgi:formamidopyrimidine-DNA glycosylase
MELPEIMILAGQMEEELVGKRVARVEVENVKCLNVPLEEFRAGVLEKEISYVRPRGKWVFIGLDPGHVLLFNTGMGADVIYFEDEGRLPEKYHIMFLLDDGTGFTVRVWWFCYLHLVPEDCLDGHKLTKDLGPSPLEDGFTLDHFRGLLRGRRGGVKTFLTNQRNVAGIGNVYIQDILFGAGVHPLRKIPTLTDTDVEALYDSMKAVLTESIEYGGLTYEKNFYGRNGGYGKEQYRVAYKPDEACPDCGTTIEKIKTGSTSSFICPRCQPLG